MCEDCEGSNHPPDISYVPQWPDRFDPNDEDEDGNGLIPWLFLILKPKTWNPSVMGFNLGIRGEIDTTPQITEEEVHTLRTVVKSHMIDSETYPNEAANLIREP